MNKKLQIVFPCAMSAVSLPFIVWDFLNQRVVTSMGMGWDMGAPVWPYQTPDILLRFLNAPAYFLAMPLANFLGLIGPAADFVIFPTILIWWWFLGLSLDHGLVKAASKWRWWIFVGLIVCAVLLLSTTVFVSVSAISWWFKYGGDFGIVNTLLTLRFLGPAVWCLALFLLFIIAARRVVVR